MRKTSHVLLLALLFIVFAGTAGVAIGGEEDQNQEARLLSNIRQVTFEGKRAGEGYFNVDATQLVFQSERDPENPFFQIFLMDLETGDTAQISPGMGKTTCSWVHPDGKKVMYASTHLDPDAVNKQKEELDLRAKGQQRRYSWDYDEHFELFETDPATGETTRLTDAVGYDAEGSYSPDGRYIAFSSNRRAYERELTAKEKEIFETDKSYFLDIFIMNADGTDVRQLTDVPGYDGGPFFSADGKKICWRRFSEDGAIAEVYTMNIDGSDQKQVTRLGAMSWAPYFHPSGDYLIFNTNLQGFANFELYVVDAEGKSEPQRVTFTEGFDGLATFAYDGKRLTWTSNRTSNNTSQIFFADWDDAQARELLGLNVGAKTAAAISVADLKTHVEELASDKMQGRLTGSEGEILATRYGAARLKAMGLAPGAPDGSYFQAFEFTAGVSVGAKNSLSLESEGAESVALAPDSDWRPAAFSKTGEVEPSEVVFAGYGLVAPSEEGKEGYDSYVHLDVENKWVVAFRFLPEGVSAERRQHLAHFSGIRYKAMAARERGARGLILVSGPNSQVEHQLVPISFDASVGTISLAVVSVTDEVGQRLLSAAGKDLKALQDELDSGDPVMGFAIPGVKLSANVDLAYEKRSGRNVIARLASGSDPKAPAVIIGAHVDHLGTGEGMSTLAREDEKGGVHYGADDNASGSAALLEVAEYLADMHRQGKLNAKRDIVFALWSGEELGLLGSSSYANAVAKAAGNEADLHEQFAAYLNMDMVGRLRKELILQGVGSSSIWPSEIEKRNAPVGLAIATQNDSYLPTDATSFYLKRVPILAAFTGVHSEYHSPRDRAETLNYEGMQKVARLMALIARSLAMESEAPDYVEMKRPTEGGGKANLRAYLGTIPDYAQGDAVGMKLSGVIGGGPAEAAGLQGGDIIVELAGRKIENIYDYTYAIEALKIGETVTVVVMRGGERLSMELTPGSRQ